MDGEHVCTARSTRSSAAHRGLPKCTGHPGRQTARGHRTRAAAVPATRRDLVRYAGASGDFNVIHWNERIAKSVGLPDVIAHGMLTMALAGRFVTELGRGDPAAVTRIRRAGSPPWSSCPMTTRAPVIEVSRAPSPSKLDGNRVAVNVTARSGGAKVLTRARAVVRLP